MKRSEVRLRKGVRGSGRYKRLFDLAVLATTATLFAPLWIPLCLLFALAIRLEDGGPALLRQRRVGRYGRPFLMLKFGTMVPNAERLTGPVLASSRDPRITRIGTPIRRLHLDEIPRAVNVLRGEMSLVGPRPERPTLMARISRSLPPFPSRLDTRPGIAGLAESRSHYHASPRDKLRDDRLYIANMGPWLDIKLLAACVLKALFDRRPRRRIGKRPRRTDLRLAIRSPGATAATDCLPASSVQSTVLHAARSPRQ